MRAKWPSTAAPHGNDGALWREPEWVDGRFGKALHFDGQSFIWIKVAKGVPQGKSPRTLMCQFRLDDVALGGILMTTGKHAWRAPVSLGVYDAGPGVHTFDDVEHF